MSPNPNQMWSDIDPALPATKIVAFGPPPTSGTRDAFVELVMHDSCKGLPGMADLKKADEKKWTEVCSRMRQDGPFVEAGENDNLIVQRLEADANSFGIFGTRSCTKTAKAEGRQEQTASQPTPETIADGSYPVARPLFFYVKNAHRDVIPGMKEFLEEYMSDAALGPDGYMAERGLTLLPEKLKEAQKRSRRQEVRFIA